MNTQPKKQSSPGLSSKGARYMRMTDEQLEDFIANASAEEAKAFWADFRSAWASVVSQDETKGNV